MAILKIKTDKDTWLEVADIPLPGSTDSDKSLATQGWVKDYATTPEQVQELIDASAVDVYRICDNTDITTSEQIEEWLVAETGGTDTVDYQKAVKGFIVKQVLENEVTYNVLYFKLNGTWTPMNAVYG